VAAVRGIRRGRLATFGAVQTAVAESGRDWIRLGVADPDQPPDPGSDAALLADGYATVTALRPLCAAPDVPLPFESSGPSERVTATG
jgi:5'-nucleotidase